jgi:hypothetical protein
MLRKQKAATNVQARLVCAEVYRDANPVCRCFRRPAEYTAGGGRVQCYVVVIRQCGCGRLPESGSLMV